MSDLWLPNSRKDLEALPASSVISQQTLGYSPVVLRAVVKTGPNVLIKYARDLAEEVLCARFALEEAALPVPRILHYPGDPHYVVTPGWAHVLQAVFPGERRTTEIDALDQLLAAIRVNFT